MSSSHLSTLDLSVPGPNPSLGNTSGSALQDTSRLQSIWRESLPHQTKCAAWFGHSKRSLWFLTCILRQQLPVQHRLLRNRKPWTSPLHAAVKQEAAIFSNCSPGSTLKAESDFAR